jgi:hypothetical protein
MEDTHIPIVGDVRNEYPGYHNKQDKDKQDAFAIFVQFLGYQHGARTNTTRE